MYIRMTFICAIATVPGSWSGCFAKMLAEPLILDELPEDFVRDHGEAIRNHQYVTVIPYFGNQEQSMIRYYQDCSKLDRETVQQALAAFNKHYAAHVGKAVLIGADPDQNEIITNLKIALENVRLPAARQKAFLSASQNQAEAANNGKVPANQT